ncbi:MAG: hypothetical protein O3A46_09540, partial [Candidatus Poribacteria bacterium]|nr:hypothetical protein [Candidatus Poribacteria bacterium]
MRNWIFVCAALISMSAMAWGATLNWERLDQPTGGSGVGKLVVEGDTLYLTLQGVVHRSTDGRRWEPIIDPSIAGINSIPLIQVLLQVDGTFYAVDGVSRILKSENRCESWTRLGFAYTSNLVYGDGVFYMGYTRTTPARINRSLDSGETWDTVEIPEGNAQSRVLYADDLVVFADVGSRLYRSDDHGATWVLADTGLPVSTKTAVVQIGNRYLVYVSGEGVYQSENKGQTWRVNSFAGMELASLLAVDGTLFASPESDNGGGLFRSDDQGDSWRHFGLDGDAVTSLTKWNGDLYATARYSIHRFDAGTATWIAADDWYSSHNVYAIEGNDERLFAGTNAGVYASLDGGASWEPTLNKRDTSTITVDGNNVYSGSYFETAMRSLDNGETWTWMGGGVEEVRSRDDGTDVQCFVVTNDGMLIWVGYHTGTFVSMDRGDTWRNVEQ